MDDECRTSSLVDHRAPGQGTVTIMNIANIRLKAGWRRHLVSERDHRARSPAAGMRLSIAVRS